MTQKTTNVVAFLLLSIMFISAFSSYLGDSLTMDELSHIPAGYSYLSQKDFRINPEHPPLIKDLAAFPLLFLNLNFPSDSDAWNKDVNSQWRYGWELLYNSGNNPEQMIFWARLPMVFVLILLGWFMFYWTKKEFGNKVALLALTLFTFSPTLLAHGRLVTTDVGATFGILLAIYFWLEFLKRPSKKNVILAGIVFGIAMLLKFSVVLIIPLFIIITFIYSLLKRENIFKYLILSALIGVIGTIFVILPVYQFHILNYPVQRQLSDTIALLGGPPMESLKTLCIWMADKPILRTLSHYLLGLLMATQRTAFGNTVYFMDMISSSGWWYYFPVVYILKLPLAFHILTIITLLLGTYFTKDYFWKNTFKRLKNCIEKNFTAFTMTAFLMIYWITSITGNLNIGVRHVLPVFPFTFILVSWILVSVLKKIEKPAFKKAGVLLTGALLCWYIFSSLSSYPYYLSYFNELAGGTDNGYKYVVDSNYDWGQDLKRLKKWVDEKGIEKIKVDYFGGGDLNYYLGNKWERLDSQGPPQEGWLAISATLLQGGRGYPVPGFNQSALYYKWLDDYIPVDRAGKSIFIYYIED